MMLINDVITLNVRIYRWFMDNICYTIFIHHVKTSKPIKTYQNLSKPIKAIPDIHRMLWWFLDYDAL